MRRPSDRCTSPIHAPRSTLPYLNLNRYQLSSFQNFKMWIERCTRTTSPFTEFLDGGLPGTLHELE
jgi:hypothetical protein